MKKKSITRITICGRAGRVMVAISIEVTFCCLLVYCCCCLVYICTNCWSVGIGTGYKLFLHRNATNHLSDHSVSSTQSSLWVWSWYLEALLIFCSSDSQEHKYRLLVTSGLMFFFFVLYSLPIIVVALGITAAALIPSFSETTQLSANTTFNNYLSDQIAQENFNNAQHSLKTMCCGVVAFTAL